MLCPRCMGLHAGFVTVLILVFLTRNEGNPLKSIYSKIFCFLALGFLGVEWLLAQAGYTESTIESRYFSGWFAGNAFALLVFAYRGIFISGSSQVKSKNHFSVLFVLISALIAGIFYLRSNNWTFLTLTLVLAVVVNFVFVLHTAYRRIRLIDFNPKMKQV